MAAGKLSPRQKMINMMYLVLTALLALNVSKEVLNSFFEVNLGIVKTTKGLDKKNQETYDAFDQFANPKLAENHKILATKIKPKALELMNFIQEMKYNLVLKADDKVFLGAHLDEEGEEILDNIYDVPYSDLNTIEQSQTINFLNAKDDRHSSGELFYREDESGVASELKSKILEFKGLLLNTLEKAKDDGLIPNDKDFTSLIDDVNTTFDIKDGKVYGEKVSKKVTWEHYNFYDMPSVGALTILSKWQSDIKTTELGVVGHILSHVLSERITATGMQATTIPSSKFILQGDNFESKIFLSAVDEETTPEIFIGSYEKDAKGKPKLVDGDPVWIKTNEYPNPPYYTKVPVKAGKGTYTIKGGSVGIKEYEGLIKILQDKGYTYYNFEGDYTVAKTSAVASPDYMMQMYTGCPNPITVSAAGYNSKDLKVKVDQKGAQTEQTKPGKGKAPGSTYNITPVSKGNLTVTISGPNSKGKMIKLGTIPFIVEDPPPPIIKLGFLNDELVSTKDLKTNNKVKAVLPDWFKFKGVVYITSTFDVNMVINGEQIEKKGQKDLIGLTSYINKMDKGDQLNITNIIIKRKLGNGKYRTYDMKPKPSIFKKIK